MNRPAGSCHPRPHAGCAARPHSCSGVGAPGPGISAQPRRPGKGRSARPRRRSGRTGPPGCPGSSGALGHRSGRPERSRAERGAGFAFPPQPDRGGMAPSADGLARFISASSTGSQRGCRLLLVGVCCGRVYLLLPGFQGQRAATCRERSSPVFAIACRWQMGQH